MEYPRGREGNCKQKECSRRGAKAGSLDARTDCCKRRFWPGPGFLIGNHAMGDVAAREDLGEAMKVLSAKQRRVSTLFCGRRGCDNKTVLYEHEFGSHG